MAVGLGADDDVADEVARHLVRAELSGHASHGVLRLPQYAQEVDRG
ncbi:Ldh family oxidoreductase [Streptomyces sp. NPDC021212]